MSVSPDRQEFLQIMYCIIQTRAPSPMPIRGAVFRFQVVIYSPVSVPGLLQAYQLINFLMQLVIRPHCVIVLTFTVVIN